MGRGSTQALLRSIIQSLAEGPKTISEVAESTRLDRTAVGRYLAILTESGLLIEEQEGTSKKFTIIPTYRTDTYFGLPLTQVADQQINSVYHLIKKSWSATTAKKLSSTHAQKIAYKAIASCDDLKIPTGWYLYGGISVVTFNELREYNYYGLPKEVEQCVVDVTTEYAKNDFAWQAKKQQYKEAGKEIYDLKEDILSIIYSARFDGHPKNSCFVLVKLLRRLITVAPKEPHPQYMDVLDAYQDLMLDITNHLEDEVIRSNKREITVLFEAIWKYIALFNFKHDLRRFYPEKVLEAHFRVDIQQQEEEIIELGTDLQSLIPETATPSTSLHEALAKMRNPGPETRSEDKIEVMRAKLGEEKLQQWLLEQAGLQ